MVPKDTDPFVPAPLVLRLIPADPEGVAVTVNCPLPFVVTVLDERVPEVASKVKVAPETGVPLAVVSVPVSVVLDPLGLLVQCTVALAGTGVVTVIGKVVEKEPEDTVTV